MMKLNKYVVGIALIAASLQACKKSLTDTNTNPNLLDDTAPEFLFTGATADIGFGSRDAIMNRLNNSMRYAQYVVSDGADAASIASQYWSSGGTTGPNPGLPYYNLYFTAIGRDMDRIIKKIDNSPTNLKSNYAGLKAICQAVNIYYAWKAVDVFGAMPYNEAFDGITYPLPKYELDADLYKPFDAKLKEAATTLKNLPGSQKALGDQDVFFGGDYAKWLSFTNTLRIKIAQRYEKRDAAHLTSVVNDVSANFGKNLISSNAGSFVLNHSRDFTSNNDDVGAAYLTQNKASFPLVEHLKATGDPRISFMIRKNDFGTNSSFYRTVQSNGTPASIAALAIPENTVRYWGKHPSPAAMDNAGYGATGSISSSKNFPLAIPVPVTGATTQNLLFISQIQTRLFLKNGGWGSFNTPIGGFLHDDEQGPIGADAIKLKTILFSYAETCFMMAEIAQKGGDGMGKTAEQWYRDGITASFDQYKAEADAGKVTGAGSLALGSFATNIPFLGLPSIYSQAWVHFFMQPEEGWALWKRTGYPQFTDVRAGDNGLIGTSTIAYLENLWNGSNNLLIPRRSSLNLSSSLNQANYDAAINALKAKDPAYGVNAQDTKGRIWWDKQ